MRPPVGVLLAVAGAAAVLAATAPGSDASGATAVALASLAGPLLLLSVRSPAGRRLVGVVLAALHAGLIALGVLGAGPVLVGAGLLGLVGAALLIARPRPVVPAPRDEPAARAPLADSLSAWKAMDAGVDPTDPDAEKEKDAP